MNYLLDTCVICEMMKKRPDEKVVKWFCKQEPKTLYLSYLTGGVLRFLKILAHNHEKFWYNTR